MAESSSNPMEWLKPFFSMFWAFIFIGIFCEIGQQFVAEQFELFNDVLVQSNWYLFPIDVQQMVSVLMVNAQQPMYIRGFGNVICAREAFKSVNTCFEEEKNVYPLCSIFMIILFSADN